MINFTLVIPVFNEKDNIGNLLDEIKKTLIEYKNYEIIIVNDCSTDETKDLILSLIKNHPIKLFNNPENLGQSASILCGVKNSKFDTIITLDGDGQNDPKDINLLLDKYFSDNNLFLVGGVRKKRKDNLIKIFSSRIANMVRGYILNDKCIDTGCGLKVFDKKIFLSFPFFNGIHRFLPALFTGYGKKTFFINVNHRPRLYGYSKYGTFKRLINGLKDIIKVWLIIKNFKKKM